MTSWYQEELLDHFRHPRGKGQLDAPDFTAKSSNPSCSDEVIFYGKIEDGKLDKVSFQGKGCVISQAAASMLVEQVIGKSTADIMQLSTEYMQKLVKISLGPVRLKCALLSLEALQNGIQSTKK